MADLHFSIGEEFGKRITEIAVEKVICDYMPEKGIRFIQESLVGINRDLCLKIMSGRAVLTVDVKNQIIETERYNPEVHDKPFDFEYWVQNRLLEIKEISEEWRMTLNKLKNEIFTNSGVLSLRVKISYRKLFQYIQEEDDLLDYIDEDNEIVNIKAIVRSCYKFIETSNKFMEVNKWIYNNLDGVIPEGYTLTPIEFNRLIKQFFSLITNSEELQYEIRRAEYNTDLLNQYIKGNKSIEESLKEGIKPVNILDGYDAGWLSPNGEFYGLNGTTANLLHITIADELVKSNIIQPETKKDIDNPDRFLDKLGWLKIHHNEINYSGFYFNPIIPLTKIQKQILCDYGKKCCSGNLSIHGKLIPVSKFRATEDIMLSKLFR